MVNSQPGNVDPINVDPVNTDQRPPMVCWVDLAATKGALGCPGRMVAFKWSPRPHFEHYNFISMNLTSKKFFWSKSQSSGSNFQFQFTTSVFCSTFEVSVHFLSLFFLQICQQQHNQESMLALILFFWYFCIYVLFLFLFLLYMP